jgi:arylsulfatase A-like enzyme/predicted negative regulator of RcsB-dependent stress response
MKSGLRCISSAGLVLAALAGSLGGCERAERGGAPASINVILISIDTLRADHLGCYGHPRLKTPHIDQLATEGLLFEQCTVAAPVTLPSHASMLTGTYPFVHKVRDNGTFRLHPDNLTLTEVLREAGFATVAQVGAFVLNHGFGLDQGFDTYRDVGFTASGAAGQGADTEISAEQVTDGAIALLRRVAGGRFFMFVHYFDPHQPYRAPQRFAAQYINPYPAEVAYVDEQVGRLLAAVAEAGLSDDTLIVLTSDHGEGLGEHQEATHAYFVYDTTLAVPLILRCPGRIAAGGRVAAQVRTIDIAPTILALLGLPALPDGQGVDLSPLIDGQQDDLGLDAYAETFYTKYNLGFSQLRALRCEGWKYIHAPRPELYNLRDDPQEARDLADAHPERVEELRARMRALLARAPRVVQAAQARRAVTPRDLQRLESLGYVGGGSEDEPHLPDEELALFAPAGPNPMDHKHEIHLTTRAVGLVQTGQHQKIEQAIRELLVAVGERSQKFVWAHAHLAGALAAQGKLAEALEHFDLAIAARPEDGQMYTMKGMVLRALNRPDEAQVEFEQALELEPVFAMTHLHFGDLLAARGQPEAALAQYRLAIEKDALLLRAHVGLARLLVEANRVSEALGALEQAIEAARTSGDAQAVKQLEDFLNRLRGARGADAEP